ncbi:MAG: methyltransferase domain-containing protein [Chloroflexi bacterium]|nr:methyltransferase domain-containing protein [Chloroflexota bacterium]
MKPESSYDERYGAQEFHWGTKPSAICQRVLRLVPPDRPVSLLDIGCGEGRNAVFFAHSGYEVTAFDLSAAGVAKTERLAEAANATLRVFQANMNEHRLEENFDVLFSTGVFHLIPRRLRRDIFLHYKKQTLTGGLNVFSVFVRKPFIGKAPDSDPGAEPWLSGELLTLYHDWKIEYSTEEIFDCMSGGVPHQHAMSRMIARKV